MKTLFHWLPVGLGIVFLAGFAWLARERAFTGQNDFAAFYAGGRLAGTPELYSRPANAAIVRQTTGVSMPAVVFIRPPFYAALLKPLSQFPYRAAYALFSLLGLACSIWFVARFSDECPSLPFFAAMSIPVADALCNGQDTPLLVAITGLSIVLARKKRDFLAGLVLSLCAIKFHLFLLLPVALLLHRRWRVLAGGMAGLVTLSTLGALVNGPGSFLAWMRVLRDPSIGFSAGVMPNLHGLVAVAGGDRRLEVLLTVAVLAAFLWTVSRVASFEALVAASIVCGLLVNYHSGIADDVLLLVVFAVVTANYASSPMRSLIALLLTPVPWFMVLAGSPYNAIVPMALLVLMSFFCVLRPGVAQVGALLSDHAH